MGIYQSYRKAMTYTYEGLEPDFMLVGALFIAALSITYAGMFFDLMLGGLLAVLVFDFAIGYPMFKRDARVSSIERMLPDVLNHMGTTLKAGGTIETALKEVSRNDYGPITKELKTMMREIKEGKTFEEAFTTFGEHTESIPVQRSVNVIISAKRTGGGLVEALVDISDDMRQAFRLRREREAKTMVQVLFIIIAGNLVAPFIFGLVAGIIVFLATIGGGSVPPLFDSLIFYFKGFLMLTAVFSSAAASLIKDGKIIKAVIYAPLLIIVTYVVFIGVSTFAQTFFVA